MAGISFFYIHSATDIMFPITEFEDINIIPHSIKIQQFIKKQKADIVRRSLLNIVTSVGISTTDEHPAFAEATAGEGGGIGIRTLDTLRGNILSKNNKSRFYSGFHFCGGIGIRTLDTL